MTMKKTLPKKNYTSITLNDMEVEVLTNLLTQEIIKIQNGPDGIELYQDINLLKKLRNKL